MLVGGNVVCLRTGDSVSAGMLGLPADPRDLPRQFPNGDPTYGLGYVIGPDNRQAVARTDLPSRAARRSVPACPPLDGRFALAMSATAWQGTFPLSPAASAGVTPALAPVPDDEPSAPGRSCSDAVLAVLTGEMARGEVITRAGKLVTGSWGRPKPFSLKAVTDALAAHVAAGRAVRTEHGRYAPARASLTLVGGSDGAGTTEAGA